MKIEELKNMIASQPDNMEAYQELVSCYMAAGNQKEAINYLQLIINHWPNHVGAYSNLGSIHLKQANWSEAGKAFLRVTQLQPTRVSSWVNLAFIFDKLNNHKEAIKCSEKALALKPDAKRALNILAFSLLKIGKNEQAQVRMEELATLSPNSVEIEYMLAAISGDNQPDQSPADYVISIFNGYAANFETALVDKLKYNVPELLDVALRKKLSNKKDQLSILDLGCGSGLMGERLKDISSYMVGVDLSEKMLAQAEKKQIYDELLRNDILDTISVIDKKFDLVVAADVFIYIGELSKIFEKINYSMNEHGLFGFSIELTDSNADYQLQPTGRYAQTTQYISELASNNNFYISSSDKAVVRMEQYKPVDGYIYILKKAKVKGAGL